MLTIKKMSLLCTFGLVISGSAFATVIPFAGSVGSREYYVGQIGTYTCSANNNFCVPMVTGTDFGTYSSSQKQLNAPAFVGVNLVVNFSQNQGTGDNCYQWNASSGVFTPENVAYCQVQTNNYFEIKFSGQMNSSHVIQGNKMSMVWNLGTTMTMSENYRNFTLVNQS